MSSKADHGDLELLERMLERQPDAWREFQRRLQHGQIEQYREFLEAAEAPPCVLQQCYDARRQRIVYLFRDAAQLESEQLAR